MSVFLSHESALEYWRQPGRDHSWHRFSQERRRSKMLSSELPGSRLNAIISETGLSLPLDILLGSSDLRRSTPLIHQHVFTQVIPEACFVSIGKGLFVSTPEFCFFQMAGQLSLIELIELGYELCGSYSQSQNRALSQSSKSVQQAFDDCIYNRLPLTNVKKLSAFVDKLAGVKGHKQSARALSYITDNSASPMETKLVMLLSLPYKLGGFGLPMPNLNHRIVPTKTARQTSIRKFYFCDLFWPHSNLAVEYDSDLYHTGTERIASDSRRRSVLSLLGINVITVTSHQIQNSGELEQVAKLIAQKTGRRLQHMRNPKSRTAQLLLRKALL